MNSRQFAHLLEQLRLKIRTLITVQLIRCSISKIRHQTISYCRSFLVGKCVTLSPLCKIVTHNNNVLVTTFRHREGSQDIHCHPLHGESYWNLLQGKPSSTNPAMLMTAVTPSYPPHYVLLVAWPIESSPHFGHCTVHSHMSTKL